MRIFVIDDELIMSTLVARIFRRANHEVVTTNEPLEAAEVAANGSYDFIVTDFEMPGRTGPEVVAELRTRGCYTPIALMSGNHEKLETVGGSLLASGQVQLLVKKPDDLATLVADTMALLNK